MTLGQLKKRGLKTNAPRRAVVGGMVLWDLFDVAEAIPFTAEELAAQKELAHQARYCHCKRCDRDVRKEKYSDEYRACHKCLPEVLRMEDELERDRRESAQAELRAMFIQDRDGEIRWARSQLTRSDWVILDTETTGLDWSAEIISISVIAPDGEVLFDTLVQPSGKIPAEASSVNGITDSMVADAPKFADIFPQLDQVLKDKLIVAYNAEFDRQMLQQTCRRYGLEIAPNWKCAMLAYSAWVGEWSSYFGSYKWQRLPQGDHTARGDCLATLELIQCMASSPTFAEQQIIITYN
jgi:DNA polymerase-3 subunit epsilon